MFQNVSASNDTSHFPFLKNRHVTNVAFAGKAFLWSLGALGARGPAHLIDLWIEEMRATLGQLGCKTVADLRSVPVRHGNAYRPGDFAARA